MSPTQRDLIEQRLLVERGRALRALGRHDEASRRHLAGGSSDLPHYPTHMADQATDMMERELSLFFASKEGRYLQEVEAALRRLHQAPRSFGVCRSCGAEIPFQRLDAVPCTERCLECQRGSETPRAAA